jgi:hypothetical protein
MTMGHQSLLYRAWGTVSATRACACRGERGKWNQELLPVRWETIQISLKDAYQIRRVFRKLAGIRSTDSLCRITIFVRYKNMVRLLGFLGYQLSSHPALGLLQGS